MTNEQLVALIQGHVDEAENMLRLWEQNRAFIYRVARRFSGYEELEDLLQVGYLGLCDAVAHYSAGEGCSFLVYASWWIRQAMHRHVMSGGMVIRLPEHMSGKVRQYRRMVSDWEKTQGRRPRRDEIKAFLRVSEIQLRDIEKAARTADIQSLDAPAGEETEGLTLGDMSADLFDLEETVLEAAQEEELRRVLWPLVDELPEELPQVIRSRFQRGETLKETGERIGTTQEKARQLEARALRTLRSPRYARRLLPFREELAGVMAYRGGAEKFRQTWTSSTERAALELM